MVGGEWRGEDAGRGRGEEEEEEREGGGGRGEGGTAAPLCSVTHHQPSLTHDPAPQPPSDDYNTVINQ